jgi:hypothetical protein
VAFHVFNDELDVDRALHALGVRGGEDLSAFDGLVYAI